MRLVFPNLILLLGLLTSCLPIVNRVSQVNDPYKNERATVLEQSVWARPDVGIRSKEVNLIIYRYFENPADSAMKLIFRMQNPIYVGGLLSEGFLKIGETTIPFQFCNMQNQQRIITQNSTSTTTTTTEFEKKEGDDGKKKTPKSETEVTSTNETSSDTYLITRGEVWLSEQQISLIPEAEQFEFRLYLQDYGVTGQLRGSRLSRLKNAVLQE